jgi:hypothetical protein
VSPLDGKVGDVILSAVYPDVGVVQKGQRDGILQTQAQFPVGSEFIQTARARNLVRRFDSVIEDPRENLGAGGRSRQQPKKNNTALCHVAHSRIRIVGYLKARN